MTEADPYYPIRWGKNQSGMQAKEENLSFEEYEEAKRIWDYMAQTCRYGVKRLNEIGLHKQWANRPLEWLSWITVIVSGTDWKNFLALRDHPAAMPEFGHIAAMVREAFARSTPKLLQPGEWHLPFTEDAADLRKTHHEDAIRMVSAGRCARVSYLNHEGVRDPIDDFRLAQRLTAQVPGHWGPFEHVARSEKTRARIRNFRGFTQYRALLDETSEEV
jgi:thymidylate synthase ThyX